MYEIKIASGKAYCRYGGCTKDPNFVEPNGKIKAGTLCSIISGFSSGGVNSFYYCRNCTKEVFNNIKNVYESDFK